MMNLVSLKDACSSSYSEWIADEKRSSQEWKSDEVMEVITGRLVSEQPAGLSTQHNVFDSRKLFHVMLTFETKITSLRMICPGEPHERNPHAHKFEDRSLEETEWQE